MSRSSQLSIELELDSKNKTIKNLERAYSKALEDVQFVQQELHTARSYIKMLPTRCEIETIKKELINCKDEQAQLIADLCRLKEKNSNLESKILNLNETIFNMNLTLESKTTEIERLQDTLKRWEQRRKAAVEAGEITVEDVLADKMKLETEIASILDYISEREKKFCCKLEAFKSIHYSPTLIISTTKIMEEKQRNQSGTQEIRTLRAKLQQLEEQLSKSEQTIVKMDEIKQNLDEDYRQLSSELSVLTERDERRGRTEERCERILDSISRCRIDGQKMIRFVQSALQRQFLDPSLLFPASKDEEERLVETGERRATASTDDLEERAEARLREVLLLERELRRCQEQMNQLYVTHLSSSLSSQCNVQ